MKNLKKTTLIFTILSFLTLFTSANAEIKVVASIKPIHSLVSNVMDGVGKPDVIVDGYNSPHGFSLKPSHAKMIENADLIINTTPIGMNSNNTKQENVPLGLEIWDYLSNKTILYDLIYTPRPTKWLKLGQQKNCFTIDGLDMLVEQGAFSIRLWSGFNDIPVQTMKSSAKKHLMV